MIFRLTCPITPVPQPRQKIAVVEGRAHNYTPTEHPVNVFKATLRLMAQQEWRVHKPLEGPLVLSASFYLPRPKRLMRKKDPTGPVPHIAVPDLDNLLKALKDSLKGVVWRDDSQVALYGPRTGKWYHEKDGIPRVEIAVQVVTESEEVG